MASQSINGNDLEKFRSVLLIQLRSAFQNPAFRTRFSHSDIVGETMVRAWKERNQFEGKTDGELFQWLSRIMTNILNDTVRHARAAKRDIHLERSINQLVESSRRIENVFSQSQVTPSQVMMQREDVFQLADALTKLPEDQRDAIVMKHIHGKKINEIAEEMSKTPKAVMGLLNRGRNALRQLLTANEGEHSHANG